MLHSGSREREFHSTSQFGVLLFKWDWNRTGLYRISKVVKKSSDTYTVTNHSERGGDIDVNGYADQQAYDEGGASPYSIISVYTPDRQLGLETPGEWRLFSNSNMTLTIGTHDIDVFRELGVFSKFTYSVKLEKTMDSDWSTWEKIPDSAQCYTISGTKIVLKGAAVWNQVKSTTGKAVRVNVSAYYKGREIAATCDEYIIEAAAPMQISKASVAAIAAQKYTGKARTPRPEVRVEGWGGLTYGTDYTLAYKNNVNVGTATVTIKGKGEFTGTKSVTFKITKAANTMTAKAKAKTHTFKYSKLKKKNQTITAAKAYTISKNKGTLSYKLTGVTKAKFKKYFSVNAKTGKITIKKKLKKGTYTLSVKVTAKGTANYKAASKTLKVKVKVK